MNEKEFEHFLHKHIPMTEAMGISVIEINQDRVRVAAGLQPNINHKATAFGGSINSLMTVCGWAMVFVNIKPVDEDVHIVIQKSSINYIAPVEDDFIAECVLTEDNRNELLQMYKRHGRARIRLDISCYCRDKLTAKFEGQYVVFK